jgi:tetratricopeptide (TPR) repeat protein
MSRGTLEYPGTATEPSTFFVAGGTLPGDAPCYASRKADTELVQALQRGEFCYVLTSRQMGKSSLTVRAAAHLRAGGTDVVIIDLTAFGNNLDVERWYFCLLSKIGEKLRLETEMEDYWQAHLDHPPLARWTGALREVILAKLTTKVVLFIDEIDYIRSLPFGTDEFFAGVREFYNRRTEDPALQRLTFCVLGVATPADLIRDERVTPFNIGRGVELTDFTIQEAQVFRGGLHPVPAVAEILINRVLFWTGGHPYLTQKLCTEVVKAGAVTAKEVDAVCDREFLAPHQRDRDNNLHLVRERLLKCDCDLAGLLDLYARLCRGQRVKDDDTNPLVTALGLAGITRSVNRQLRIRNQIYARVFDLRWVKECFPDAERRRQRAAFFRGVRRVVGSAVVAITFMGWTAFYAFQQKKEALQQNREALQQKKEALQLKEEALQAAAKAARNESLANERARQLDAAKTQIAQNLTRTQDSIGKLLEALAPVLEVKSPSREKILLRAHDLYADTDGGATLEVERGKAGLLRAWSRLYGRLGQSDEAVTYAQQALNLTQRLVNENPADLDLPARLLECHNALGDALLGDRDDHLLADTPESKRPQVLREAISQYEKGLDLAQTMANQHPESDKWRRLVLDAQNNIGDVQVRLAMYEDAQASYEGARLVIVALLKEAPGSWELRENLAASFDRLGDLRLRQKLYDEARQLFQNGFDIRQRHLNEAAAAKTADPDRDQVSTEFNQARSALATSLNKLGKAHDYLGNRATIAKYEESLRLREEVAKAEPRNLEWQRNLAISCNNVASTLKAKDKRRAGELYRKRVEIARRLFEEDPSNRDWKRDYCNALNNLADFLMNFLPRDNKAWKEALIFSGTAAKLTDYEDPRFLVNYAQALRLDGHALEGRRILETALKNISPEGERSRELDAVIKELRKELEVSKKTPGAR